MDRFYVKPRPGLTYEALALWLSSQGDSPETLAKTKLTVANNTVTDVLEITSVQVANLQSSEYSTMVTMYRQSPDGHVSLYHSIQTWR